jgi:general secretion pathway protein J
MRRSSNNGFTLIEMIIAVAITLVMMAIGYTGLNHTIKTADQVGEANLRLSELQFGLAYFNQDWMQVSPRKIRNQYGDEENNIVIEDDSIVFTRSGWANLLQRQRSELQRVQYLLIDNNLVRRHWRSLDQGIAEEPLSTVLIHDVESFAVNFINPSEDEIPDWPNDATQNVGSPIALKIGIELTDFGEIRRILEMPSGVL